MEAVVPEEAEARGGNLRHRLGTSFSLVSIDFLATGCVFGDDSFATSVAEASATGLEFSAASSPHAMRAHKTLRSTASPRS